MTEDQNTKAYQEGFKAITTMTDTRLRKKMLRENDWARLCSSYAFDPVQLESMSRIIFELFADKLKEIQSLTSAPGGNAKIQSMIQELGIQTDEN